MNSVIVYGPPGCGKTTNRYKLADYFGKSCVMDNWTPGDDIPDDALILTNVPGVKGALLFDSVIKKIINTGETVPNMSKFKEELRKLINTHCVENLVGMPDYLIAEMLCAVIYTVGGVVKRTLCWYGVDNVGNSKQR